MATLTGSSTAEVDAPLEQVWALVEDVERAPEWQGGLRAVHALERDGGEHAIVCQTESDAKVRTIKSTVRFTYDGPTTLTWSQEKGELKSVDGRWELEDLGGNRTRATYSLEVDLGRMLSLVIRGPLVDLVRGMLVSARAGELKRAVEGRPLGPRRSGCRPGRGLRRRVRRSRRRRKCSGPGRVPGRCGGRRASPGSRSRRCRAA
jgi:ribosome-associated toxin RatA of RatAB toxin-antitoxin module